MFVTCGELLFYLRGLIVCGSVGGFVERHILFSLVMLDAGAVCVSAGVCCGFVRFGRNVAGLRAYCG